MLLSAPHLDLGAVLAHTGVTVLLVSGRGVGGELILVYGPVGALH